MTTRAARLKREAGRIGRFSVTGVANTAVDMAVFATMTFAVGLAPVPAFTVSKPIFGVPTNAKAAPATSSAISPIHISHNPPLLTGRSGTVVTLMLLSFPCPFGRKHRRSL